MPRKIGFSTYSETFTGGDFTADEWEFVRAIAAYQKEWNRRYPSWREVLAVLESLGYRKIAPPSGDGFLAPGEKLETRIPKADPDEPVVAPSSAS